MTIKDINIHKLTHNIKRHWVPALLIFVTMGVVLTLRMLNQQSVYEATCTIEFASSSPELSLNNRTLMRYSSYVLQNLYLKTQKIIMTRAPIMKRVVKTLDLADAEKDPKGFERAQRRIAGSLSIDRIPESQIFQLKARHTDPKLATKIANTTADAYIRYSYEKKIDNYKNSIQWLDEEIAGMKAKLEQSQRALIDFIEREKITSFGDEAKNQPKRGQTIHFGETENLLEQLHAKKVEEEIKLLRAKEKYLPAHPEYKRLTAEITLLSKKIEDEQKRLNKMRQARERKIIDAKKNEIEYSILKREVEVNKEIYNALVRKHKETDIGSAIARTDANVVEYAKIPSVAIYPNKKVQAALAWIVGLIFGIGYCLIREFTDTTLKDPDDVESHFSIPLLTIIPKQKEKREGLYPFVLEDQPLAGEAFRVLRTNLNFSFPREPNGRIIMVGSTDRNEGKSTTSFNLSCVTAEMGKRTLIIDGDLRARKLSSYFKLGGANGLTNYLVGENTADQIIRSTNVDNLFIMPAGPVPPKPSTLLDSKSMQDLLEDVRTKFDEVIIDTPPIGLVIDSNIIAAMVDGLILVVSAGTISRFEVRRTLKQVANIGTQVCGIVLNKVELRSKRYYPYGRYYGYYGEEASDTNVIANEDTQPTITDTDTLDKEKANHQS